MIRRWQIVNGPNYDRFFDAMKLRAEGVKVSFEIGDGEDSTTRIRRADVLAASIFGLRCVGSDILRVEGVILPNSGGGVQFVMQYNHKKRSGTMGLESGLLCLICNCGHELHDRFCSECNSPLC